MIQTFALMLLAIVIPAASVAADGLDRGEYLFQLANCYTCHTDTENDGRSLAGGRALETEFGTFYTPNITADKETGIGAWTGPQFIDAIRRGISPDGSHYYPSFPYAAYRDVSDEDALAIRRYLFAQPAVEQQNKPHELKWYLQRFLIAGWKLVNGFMQPEPIANETRGAYLINSLGHCNECHTPRNSLGVLQYDRQFKGNKALSAPDISNTKEGLAEWEVEELEELFADGVLPDGDYVSDHMAEVVEYSTSKWTAKDRKEVIDYLRSL